MYYNYKHMPSNTFICIIHHYLTDFSTWVFLIEDIVCSQDLLLRHVALGHQRRDQLFLSSLRSISCQILVNFLLALLPFLPLALCWSLMKNKKLPSAHKKGKFNLNLPLNYVFFPCLKIFMNFYKLSYNYHSNAEARLQLIPQFYEV